jgi:succinate dehydrogenase flavin-adding protein (antitoxin of CptAB toxin-antitoxin module)
MKELDILLESFVEKNQHPLERGHWPEFEALLHQEDNVVWAWIQHPENKDARVYRDILNRILHGRG